MSIDRPLTRVRFAIRGVLPHGLGIKVETHNPAAPTFVVTIQAGQIKHKFIVGWAGEGWPADIERLLTLAADIEIMVARDLSVGARERLTNHGVGWVDETGRSNVSLPSGLIILKDAKSRRQNHPSTGWSRSKIAVAEAALSGVEPRVERIQDATGLSRGATANALVFLEKMDFLHRDIQFGPRSARRITNVPALFESYVNAVVALSRKTPVILLHRLWNDPMTALVKELTPALELTKVNWAVTGAAASHLLAPYLSNISVIELYVDTDMFSDLVRLERTLNARRVERGHLIEVRQLPNRITMTAGSVVDGIHCATKVRVYADLVAKGGRSVDAANHLREVLNVGSNAQSSGSTARGSSTYSNR